MNESAQELEPGTHRLDVGGQTFEVEVVGGGQCHFNWLSGPNPGYGFSGRRSVHGTWTVDEAEAQIRDFLSNIDPHTGHLD